MIILLIILQCIVCMIFGAVLMLGLLAGIFMGVVESTGTPKELGFDDDKFDRWCETKEKVKWIPGYNTGYYIGMKLVKRSK